MHIRLYLLSYTVDLLEARQPIIYSLSVTGRQVFPVEPVHHYR